MTSKQSKKTQGKKGGFFKRLLTLLAVLCAVLAVVVLTTMEDGQHFAALRRWLMYGESTATQDIYAYAADPANRYSRLGDSLLVVSPNTAQLLRDDGAILYSLQLNLESPQLSVGTRQAAVCDIGGGTLYLLDQNGIQRTMKTERGLSYYAARLNSGDYLAVTEQKGGYKARVSVYSPAGAPVFHFDSYDNYISDAVVTEDCRSVVMVSLESYDGAFASKLLTYDLDSAERTGEQSGTAWSWTWPATGTGSWPCATSGSPSPPWRGSPCWTAPMGTSTFTTMRWAGTASVRFCWAAIRRAISAR